MDVRSANRCDAAKVFLRFPGALGSLRHWLGREDVDGSVVNDDVERFPLVEPSENPEGRLADLFEFSPAHAARAVDDQGELALDRRSAACLRWKASKEKKVSVPDAFVRVREERRAGNRPERTA